MTPKLCTQCLQPIGKLFTVERKRSGFFFFHCVKIWKTNVGGVKRINTLRSQRRAESSFNSASVCLHTDKTLQGKKKYIPKTIKRHNQESLEKISRTSIFAKRQNSKQFAWNEMFDIETNCQSACIYCHIKTIQKEKTLNDSFVGVYPMKILK